MAEPESLRTHPADDATPAAALGVSESPAAPIEVVPIVHAGNEPGLQHEAADTPKQKECPGCRSTGARSLVVCIDGTSNQFSIKNTNVVELYSRLVKDDNQLTFYNSGIGTYAKPSWKSWSYRKQVLANKLDLAFALRFEKIILSAYAWLVDNYRPRDRIFLFGFSRGAYQVRALSAMIDIVGLLHKGNNDQIAFAYELYAAWEDPAQAQKQASLLKRLSVATAAGVKRVLPLRPTRSVPEAVTEGAPSDTEARAVVTMQGQFKKTFSRRDVKVHFVGAWDTVSSVGFIRDKTLPKTTDGMKSTCFFRHALALHEHRVKFLPEYVNGSRGPNYESPPEGTEPHTKEVWFSGSHSDIGGGSTANPTLDKFGPALRWMSYEATLAGLRIEEAPRQWEQVNVSKSMTFKWRIVECLPIKRLSYKHPGTTWLPHLCGHRSVQQNQLVHRSVDRYQVSFDLPKDEEKDTYMDATLVLRAEDEVLRLGCILDEGNRHLLPMLTSSADGLRSLRELNVTSYIYNLAQSCRNSEHATHIVKDLRMLQEAYVNAVFRARARTYMLPAADTNLTSSADAETFPFRMAGHAIDVSSVAFLSNTRVVSGSHDRTLRIWDVSTGEMTLGSPLRGHRAAIHCVAVHAARGLVASASSDSTICLWTSDSNVAVHAGKVLQDESRGTVLAVAFSPDGSHLVSGSQDGALRVWNASTGERVGEPVPRHTYWVWSVAFSSDAKRIVSGSSDRTVRLWQWSPDEAPLRPCGEPLTGHTGWVSSVTFSPDASVIASGSWDNTVRIWDVETRTFKFTLEGHTSVVFSVAFAPSGTHIVSGSDDSTVRIWDAHTGATVQVLQGHTNWVWSVAFSPDGTRIASGSYDRTVRVWDFVPPPDKSHPDEDVQAAAAAQIKPAQRR